MKRRLPLIFVAAVTVIGLVAASIAAVASGVNVSPIAYQVNGTKVSQATVDHELDWLANSKQIKQNLKSQGQTVSLSDGSINATVTAGWLTQRIEVELLRQAAARRAVAIAESTRAKLRKQLEKGTPGAPESLLAALVDLNGYPGALGLDATNLSAFFQAAVRTSNIRVDPRYGTWNPRQGVCPPTGCAPSTSAGG